MKKLMFIAALAAVGTSFAIESANIVGYTTRTMKKNAFRMLSIPWQSTSNSHLVNDILSDYQAGPTVDWDAVVDAEKDLEDYLNVAPQIQVQIISGADEGSYKIYYFLENGYVDEDDEGYVTETRRGWCDSNGVYVDGVVETVGDGSLIPGVSVWFKDPMSEADIDVVPSGSVPPDDVQIACPASFRLRAPGFPTELFINDTEKFQVTGLENITVDWDAVVDAEKDLEDYLNAAPQIQVQITSGTDEGSYKIYYYLKNGYVDEDDEGYVTETQEGWCDSNGVYVDGIVETVGDGTVPVMGAFWTRGTEGYPFTLKMVSPLTE